MEAMCHTTKTNSMEVEENQFGRRKEKEREGKEREGKERKEKGRKGEEKKEKEKKRKRGRKVAVFLRATTLRRSEFIGPKAKVCLRDASYTWVPEAGGFSEAPKR